MFDHNYKPTDRKVWQGRIDSDFNFNAFRWHQWIEILDLTKDHIDSFRGRLGFALIGFNCDAGIKKNKGRSGAQAGPKSVRAF